MSLSSKLKDISVNKEKVDVPANKDLLDLFSVSSLLQKRKNGPLITSQAKKQKTSKEELVVQPKVVEKKITVKEVPLPSDSSDEDTSSEEENDLEEILEEEEEEEAPLPQKSKANQEKVIQEEKTEAKKKEEDLRNKRTIFVGNLSTQTTKKDLSSICSPFGHIEAVRFRSVAVATPTLPKKVSFITKQFNENVDDLHAYIVYQKEESASEAARTLNGTLLLDRHIRVDLASGSSKLDNDCSVFIGNLPYDVEDESLWKHFAKCGNVTAVRVVRDRQYRIGKGFGYVMFDSPLAVSNALKMDGKAMEGRKLRISNSVRNKNKKDAKKHMKRRDSRDRGRDVESKHSPSQSKGFEGKRAVEGKSARLALPDWKVQAHKRNSYNKRKLQSKKRKNK